jgi:pimeloyl-ACP methyl ester carboxylesterase
MNSSENLTAINAITQFAEIGDKKLAYRLVGKGQPMILCHRFRANLDDWDPAFIDALSNDYQVITFDYSGLASSTGTPPNNALDFAKDVKDLAAALGLDKIIVGGWSLGGFVAQLVATEFPELVSHCILLGTKPPGVNEYQIEQIFNDTAYKPSYTVEDETILFFEPASEISREAARQSHERMAARTKDRDVPVAPPLWESYGKCMEDFVADPYEARKKIMNTAIPILVISAHHEICFPPENWFALNRKLPTTQVVTIPQTGHGPQHQYPKMVAKYISAFIENYQR